MRDIEKICQQLGFRIEYETCEDVDHPGTIAKLVLESDCYVWACDALDDLEQRINKLLADVIKANEAKINRS